MIDNNVLKLIEISLKSNIDDQLIIDNLKNLGEILE